MSQRVIRIGTRGSDLALWQARYVAATLRRLDAAREVEIRIIHTTGDRVLDRPIAAVGTQGVFVKEVQEELLSGRVDIAVHSMKDLETRSADGLALAAVPQRGAVADAMVAPGFHALAALPRGARVGTGSPRRRAQLLHLRPDLEMVPIRGNVPGRIERIAGADLTAVVLAEAGLVRLGLGGRISFTLSLDEVLPAPGQGALAIECRSDDSVVRMAVAPLHDVDTAAATRAERALLSALGGGCHAPVGAFAQVWGGATVVLEGCVAAPDGHAVERATIKGSVEDAAALGERLAQMLLQQGVAPWLTE
jgi:hydroxymethylbilane synthase